MNITVRTSTSAVRQTYVTLDIKPPKALTDAYARAEKLTAKAGDLGARPGDLEQAVAAAVLADRDPSADPDVQRVTVAHALMANAGLAGAVSAAGLEGVRDVCVEHLDDIVGDWGQAFDKAAATLAAAHERIGSVPLTDTTAILARGGDVADVWASATRAEQTIDQALNGWVNLMALARVVLDPRHRALKLAPMSLQQWESAPVKLTAWEAVIAGLALALPTIAEYRSRVASIQREQAEPVTVIETGRSLVAGREIRVRVG